MLASVDDLLYSNSRKAYFYVRELFDDALPAESTIKLWLNKVDGSPGFNQQALDKIKQMVQEKEQVGQKV